MCSLGGLIQIVTPNLGCVKCLVAHLPNSKTGIYQSKCVRMKVWFSGRPVFS